MNHAPRTNWLEVLGRRGLDVEACVAGVPEALAALERHVADLAAAAAEEAGRQRTWAGTQAAQLASLAAASRGCAA